MVEFPFCDRLYSLYPCQLTATLGLHIQIPPGFRGPGGSMS
jgi:hypothetical protein